MASALFHLFLFRLFEFKYLFKFFFLVHFIVNKQPFPLRLKRMLCLLSLTLCLAVPLRPKNTSLMADNTDERSCASSGFEHLYFDKLLRNTTQITHPVIITSRHSHRALSFFSLVSRKRKKRRRRRKLLSLNTVRLTCLFTGSPRL
jgi:hypothetical protein